MNFISVIIFIVVLECLYFRFENWLNIIDQSGNGTKFCHDFNFSPTITMQE
jgi:hypothetical protein